MCKLICVGQERSLEEHTTVNKGQEFSIYCPQFGTFTETILHISNEIELDKGV